MSAEDDNNEQAQVEQQQEAPVRRERETGRLLPRWVKRTIYAVFGPLGLIAIVLIGRSLVVQHRLTFAVDAIEGDLESTLSSLSAPLGEQAMQILQSHPVDAFLFCNQELLQEEADDARMARALALRKAIQWGDITRKRNLLRRVVDAMDEEGRLRSDALEPGDIEVLARLVEQRRAEPERTYAEDRITDVLEWIVEGTPTQPTGVERRRMTSLLMQYEKKSFVAGVAEALDQLRQEWSVSDDQTARSAAEKFAVMLEDQAVGLTEAEAELCRQRADAWEDLYRNGTVLLARAGRTVLEDIVRQGRFLDHPHIYQYISILGNRFGRVRRHVADGVWMLRHNVFAIRFLGEFAARANINPVMAVETVRLTREEHERMMRRANDRRMLECVRLLGRLGVDYVRNTDEYELTRAEEPNEFVRRYVVHTLETLEEDERVGAEATRALEQIRQADNARPGGPILSVPEA
ncbi:MAG: hypothetical protein R6V05_03775 [Candidatus Brocadiia bacterium]